jgi:hypothetical protein
LHFLRQCAIDRATPTKTSGAKVQNFEKEQFAAILDAADKESLNSAGLFFYAQMTIKPTEIQNAPPTNENANKKTIAR